MTVPSNALRPLLRAPRSVGAYIPPERGWDPIAAVIYLGDGAAAGSPRLSIR